MKPLFRPGTNQQPYSDGRAYRLGDRGSADNQPYVYDDDITLAVNVALAAGRPLLVRGHPGTGKSSLARSVAGLLGWRFLAITVSSRTSARDLQWSFDTVARLADAQALPPGAELPPRGWYVLPGVLWWAFDPESAARRGLTGQPGEGFAPAVDPSPINRDASHAVVLIDEIDKADPDVPNDLLVPLGSYQFRVEDGPPVRARRPPLVIITTNEERELPRAFLRRCVILPLRSPGTDRLTAIARAHFPHLGAALVSDVQKAYVEIRARKIEAGEQPPSVAEFLDALAACDGLGLTPAHPRWTDLSALLLAKATAIPAEEP
jgi:MoxR-like ATPase